MSRQFGANTCIAAVTVSSASLILFGSLAPSSRLRRSSVMKTRQVDVHSG
jgi:hypothetical protein